MLVGPRTHTHTQHFPINIMSDPGRNQGLNHLETKSCQRVCATSFLGHDVDPLLKEDVLSPENKAFQKLPTKRKGIRCKGRVSDSSSQFGLAIANQGQTGEGFHLKVPVWRRAPETRNDQTHVL